MCKVGACWTSLTVSFIGVMAGSSLGCFCKVRQFIRLSRINSAFCTKILNTLGVQYPCLSASGLRSRSPGHLLTLLLLFVTLL